MYFACGEVAVDLISIEEIKYAKIFFLVHRVYVPFSSLSTSSCGEGFRASFAQNETLVPSQIIEAVNILRLSHGIAPLAVHPVLMQVAQQQADGIAAGLEGHWRPKGMTLGQWLISLGYRFQGIYRWMGIVQKTGDLRKTPKGQ